MNLLKTLGKGAWQVLKTVAPTIADTAAGPFAPLVAPIMEKIFGTSDPVKLDTALINATPDQLLALKQADNAHIEKLAELGISRDKLRFDDTAGARAMNIQTRDPAVGQLAWTVVLGFFGICLLEIIGMIWFPEKWSLIPRDAIALLGMIAGFLGNEAKQVCSFYFGSSAESAGKDQTLSEIAKS